MEYLTMYAWRKKGPVATGVSVGLEGAECGEERKELEPED
jgi:hypothetical protein